MSFLEELKKRAKTNKKTIVLPEAMDDRILAATEIVLKEEIAEIILLGNPEKIIQKARKDNKKIEKAQIINPETSDKAEKYAEKIVEIDSVVTIEEARKLVKNPVFFGMMMVKLGDADGYVSGAMNTTKDILKTAMRIFKKEGTKILSTFFLTIIPKTQQCEEKVYVLSDCALNEKPGYLALSEIAMTSAKTYEKFTNNTAKVAMLSYSTHGSAKSKQTEKVIRATERAKEKWPELQIDGELQLDAAIVPEVAQYKAPNSCLKGEANVLIFPDINSGNIGCKIIERLGKAKMFRTNLSRIRKTN